MTPRLYVAAASSEIDRAEAFRDACVAMGYVVEHDWCAMVRDDIRNHGAVNVGLPDDARRAAKRLAYLGASTCDVFVLLLPGLRSIDGADLCFERVTTIGAWVELGWATHPAARAHAILLVGDSPERTVTTVDLPHVATDALALDWLRGRLAQKAAVG